MSDRRRNWLDLLGTPGPGYAFRPEVTAGAVYDYPGFRCEYYRQRNSPDTFQRVMLLIPKGGRGPFPAVIVPFYFPEAMLGEDPATREPLPKYAGITMAADLAKQGFVTVSAEAYHLTLADSALDRDDFARWPAAAAALHRAYPRWSGMGKLVADTRLLADLLTADSRVDAGRIGIAGHSLGGKMAFYTGCLDERIRALLVSDFGICWRRTNWDAPWYWGELVTEFEAQGLTHADLLGAAGGKPLALLAGDCDNEDSLPLLRQAGYTPGDRLLFLNHASGHRPPVAALTAGYDFLAAALTR